MFGSHTRSRHWVNQMIIVLVLIHHNSLIHEPWCFWRDCFVSSSWECVECENFQFHRTLKICNEPISTNTGQFPCIFGTLFQFIMIPFNARCGGCCYFSSVGNSRQNDKIKSVGKYFMLWTKPLLDMISFEIPAHSSTFHISSLVNLGEQFIMCMSWTGNNQRATDGHTFSVLCSLHDFVSLGPFRFNHDVWLENSPNCVLWWTLCNHCVMCELFRSVSKVLQHSINFCVLSFVNSNHSLIQEFKSLSQLHFSFKRYICLREKMFTLLLVQHSTLGFDSLHSLINHLTVALIFSSSFLAWQNLVSHSTCKQNIRGHKCQFISCFLASTRTKERKKRCERRKGNEERRNIGSHHDNFECVDECESSLKWDVEFHGLLLRWDTEFQGKRISCDVNEQLDFNPSISISHHHLVHLPEIQPKHWVVKIAVELTCEFWWWAPVNCSGSMTFTWVRQVALPPSIISQ